MSLPFVSADILAVAAMVVVVVVVVIDGSLVGFFLSSFQYPFFPLH